MFHSTSFSRSGRLPDRTTSHYSYSCNTIFLQPPPEEDVRIDQSWEEMASMNLGRNLQHPLPYIPPPPVRPPTSRALEDTTARHCYFRPGVLRDGRIQDQYAASSSFYSGGAAVASARTTRAEGAGVGVGVGVAAGAGAARRSITYPPLKQNQRSEQARRYHHHHYQQQQPPPLLLHSTSQNPSINPLFHYPQSDTYAPRTTTTRRSRRRRRDRHPRKEEQQQQPLYNDNYDDDLHSTFSQINSTRSGYSSSSNYNHSNSNDKITFEDEEEEVEVEEVEEEEEKVEEEPRRGRTRTRTRWGEEEEKKSSPSPSVSRRGGVMMGRGTVATAVEPIGGYYYETRVVEPEWTR